MTIHLSSEHERIVHQAIETGKYHTVDEVLDFALDSIRRREGIPPTVTRSQLAGRRIRELRKGVTLGGIPVRDLIEEDRK